MALTKVTKSGLADDSVDASKLEDGTIVAADINDGTITNDKLAGSITNAKLANSSITVNGSAVSLGDSITSKHINWQAVVTADGSTETTATAGYGYFIDTTNHAHTINLPSSPSAGDYVAIKDYAATFQNNSCIVARNGSNIQGAANNSELDTTRASVVLVYVDGTKGWLYTNESNVAALGPTYVAATGGTESTSGDFKIHVFNSSSNFVVSSVGNSAGSNSVNYLVVAGGGGGGGSGGGSGGGAGGYRTNYPAPSSGGLSVSAQTYPVTVGAAGGHNGGPTTEGKGSNGSQSVFSTITSTGGGGGGVRACGPAGPSGAQGNPGGSGGGGSNCQSVGSGNTPPVSPPQGNNGGQGVTGGGAFGHGGGGGASAVGGNGTSGGSAAGGNGGAGSPNSITGSNVTYAGGGGAGISGSGSCAPSYSIGTGGSGGGGNGRMNTCGSFPYANATGAANTGGGGGGGGDAGSNATGAPGGSGIVVVSYKYQN